MALLGSCDREDAALDLRVPPPIPPASTDRAFPDSSGASEPPAGLERAKIKERPVRGTPNKRDQKPAMRVGHLADDVFDKSLTRFE